LPGLGLQCADVYVVEKHRASRAAYLQQHSRSHLLAHQDLLENRQLECRLTVSVLIVVKLNGVQPGMIPETAIIWSDPCVAAASSASLQLARFRRWP